VLIRLTNLILVLIIANTKRGGGTGCSRIIRYCTEGFGNNMSSNPGINDFFFCLLNNVDMNIVYTKQVNYRFIERSSLIN
jgi:hypothetical protein